MPKTKKKLIPKFKKGDWVRLKYGPEPDRDVYVYKITRDAKPSWRFPEGTTLYYRAKKYRPDRRTLNPYSDGVWEVHMVERWFDPRKKNSSMLEYRLVTTKGVPSCKVIDKKGFDKNTGRALLIKMGLTPRPGRRYNNKTIMECCEGTARLIGEYSGLYC